MPNKNFLQEHPLYKKFIFKFPDVLGAGPKISINMSCRVCSSDQTFVMTNEYYEGHTFVNPPSNNSVVKLVYTCVGCKVFERYFLVRMSDKLDWIMKVGQEPAWDVSGDKDVEHLLGEHKNYLRKGLICEGQGYGIAAFAYYRRIVEEIIDELLNEISLLVVGEDKERFAAALVKTRETRVAAEKIDLVKELLPPILRPEGMNPLSVLHGALSEGLHAGSEEECLQFAGITRQVVVYLASQLAVSKQASASFTSNMRTILAKRSRSGKKD